MSALVQVAVIISALVQFSWCHRYSCTVIEKNCLWGVEVFKCVYGSHHTHEGLILKERPKYIQSVANAISFIRVHGLPQVVYMTCLS